MLREGKSYLKDEHDPSTFACILMFCDLIFEFNVSQDRVLSCIITSCHLFLHVFFSLFLS